MNINVCNVAPTYILISFSSREEFKVKLLVCCNRNEIHFDPIPAKDNFKSK